MELQIQDLVSSIRKEGFEAAQAEADDIISKAKAEADAIVSKAKAEAQKTLEDSEKEIGILRESAKISARQAQRDAVLSFKEEIKGEVEKILSGDIRKALSDEVLARLINAALVGEDASKYSVEVAEVSDALKSQLADRIREGLDIRLSKNSLSGFRIEAKDGSGYIDGSDEELTKMLMPFFIDLNI